MRRTAVGAMIGASLLATAGTPVAARPSQPIPHTAADPGAQTSPEAPAWAANEAAAAVARVAAADLSVIPTLRIRDYRIAAEMLEIAHSAAPRDEDILRRLIEAWSAAGNETRVLELTRRVVELDPRDTVSQLRLITGRILQLQDADARLNAYEGFLGPRGQSFDAAIRSRIALDAAILHQERGDLKTFADRLSRAIELDPTNKEAAALAVAFYSGRIDDRAGRLELLLTLLRADPLDPETHMEIARELSAGGAYGEAGRFYAMSQSLRDRLRIESTAAATAENMLSSWLVTGPEPLVHEMRTAVDRQRAAVRQRREVMLARGASPAELPDPEALVLDVSTGSVILAAAAASRDDELTDWAMSEYERSIRGAAEGALRAGGEAGAEAVVRGLFGELLWLRLLAGRSIEHAAEQLGTVRDQPGVNAGAIARLEGWLLLRQGMAEQAEEKLRPLADRDPVALLGLALLAESHGDAEGAASWYTTVAQREAGTIVGAYAHTRVAALSGEVPPRTSESSRLEAMTTAAAPRWLEQMVADPRTFMTIGTDLLPPTADQWGNVAVRVRIRNTAPIPLGVGPDGPINSRLLLTPSVEFGLDRAMGPATMEVASADRRLRLHPQEAMEIVVRADLGRLWRLLEQLGDKSVRLRWRVLQGFQASAEGVFSAGPLSLSTETGVQVRPPVAMSGASGPALLEAIRSGEPDRLRAAVAGLSWRWTAKPEAHGLSEEDIGRIGLAMGMIYPRQPAPVRLFMLAALPPASHAPVMSPLDAAAREERDPAVLAVYLATRITDPRDQLLSAAAESDNPRLAALAALIRDRLAEDVPTFARPQVRSQANPQPSGNRGR